MNPQYETLTLPFSTADTSCPEITFTGAKLRVSFRDWLEKDICLQFDDVVSFSWEAEEVAFDNRHRDDCSYVVRQSSWLKRHLEVGAVTLAESHRHYKLCFNATGILQVISARLELLP